ncbi:MAG: TetR/AcrR family transcriptional regulator [Burkholderiaceae bacterium]
MGHSQADKALSHQRILDEAADQIRRGGLDSLGVAALMKRVGLTHGGFYGHFASRAALLDEALEHALRAGEAKAVAISGNRPRGFAAMIRSYLSRSHRDSPQTGCAIAALVSDVGRADPSTRDVMSRHIDQYIARMAESLGTRDEAAAMAAVGTVVGALALSRVMTDPKRSDAMLRAAREHLLAMPAASGKRNAAD